MVLMGYIIIYMPGILPLPSEHTSSPNINFSLWNPILDIFLYRLLLQKEKHFDYRPVFSKYNSEHHSQWLRHTHIYVSPTYLSHIVYSFVCWLYPVCSFCLLFVWSVNVCSGVVFVGCSNTPMDIRLNDVDSQVCWTCTRFAVLFLGVYVCACVWYTTNAKFVDYFLLSSSSAQTFSDTFPSIQLEGMPVRYGYVLL